MILELVLFKSPPGMDRAAVLEDAKHTIPRWRANADLLRKHYIPSDDGEAAASTSDLRRRRRSKGTTRRGERA